MNYKTLVGAALSLLLFSQPSVYAATSKVTKSGDLRSSLSQMRSQNKLVQGKNLVLDAKAKGSTPAVKLYATVAKGKVTQWQATDANGKSLPTEMKTTAQNEGTTCYVCILAPDGSKPCYEIDCKDTPKPKQGLLRAQ
jgi:hypothetical protein